MKVNKFVCFIAILFITITGFAFDQIKINESIDLDLEFSISAYSLNDQRIYWSGLEFSFGSEAIIKANIIKKIKWGKIIVENEFFINQPFGENILKDEGRIKFFSNYEIETFESPFGRASFPIFNNNLNYGSPFIRSEAILWRETGVFINFKWGVFSADIAAVNGEENRDTNSGKAGIFRIGLENNNWRIGASMKEHDGYGSEWQKLYKSHIGLDLMFKISNLEFSGEVIWDEYGFHRQIDSFNKTDIFWTTSIYYRDIFYKYKEPIQGFGWYGNLKIELKRLLINFNYGIYVPENIGNIYHDNTIKRFILKLSFNPIDNINIYFTGVLENTKPEESWRQGAKGFAGLFGFSFKI